MQYGRAAISLIMAPYSIFSSEIQASAQRNLNSVQYSFHYIYFKQKHGVLSMERGCVFQYLSAPVAFPCVNHISEWFFFIDFVVFLKIRSK